MQQNVTFYPDQFASTNFQIILANVNKVFFTLKAIFFIPNKSSQAGVMHILNISKKIVVAYISEKFVYHFPPFLQ